MASSSRYLQALFGIIASGRRRNPTIVRQQALVSKLYPYLLKESVTSSVTIAGASILRLGAEAGFSDDAQASININDLSVTDVLKTTYSEESATAAITITDLQMISIAKPFSFSEQAEASVTLASFTISNKAIVTHVEPESLHANVNLSDFYLGGI